MGIAICAVFSILVVMAFAAIPAADAGDRPCYLWIRGWPTYDVVDSDGNPRNNPDNTLYPNDVFTYNFDCSSCSCSRSITVFVWPATRRYGRGDKQSE